MDKSLDYITVAGSRSIQDTAKIETERCAHTPDGFCVSLLLTMFNTTQET